MSQMIPIPPVPLSPGQRVRHAFTVDVEDWFHGIPISNGAKLSAEKRLDRGLNVLLDLLAEHEATATFFILGPVARDHPELVRRISQEGHEIGCHGWSHDLIYELTPTNFRRETIQAVDAISDVTGQPVTAYRAAFFSITEDSLWALEELAGMGFQCDSSVFPVNNWRYGIPHFPPYPVSIETGSGVIREIPMTVRRVLGKTIPLSGGAYFRLYPYSLTRANLQASEKAGAPAVFYIHPWELDPDHPRVRFHWGARLTHYANLCSTRPKLERLLSDFRFGSLTEVFGNA